MATTTTTPTPLPFFVNLGETTATIDDVLYEFVTNALDATPLDHSKPTLKVEGDSIVITDTGSGLKPNHMMIFGNKSLTVDPKRHGIHGIGLKDAIAFCVREKIVLTIETSESIFKFSSVDEVVNLINTPSPAPRVGTKVTVKCSDPSSVLARLKLKFLLYQSLTPEKEPCDGVQVYAITTNYPKGAVFINGVLKEGHSKLLRIYDFVAPTVDQKKSIARNHRFTSHTFKLHFKEPISNAYPRETFGGQYISHPAAGNASHILPAAMPTRTAIAAATSPASLPVPVPTPTPTAPAPAAVTTARTATSVDQAVLFCVEDNCLKQDYSMWTPTTEERERLSATKAEMVTFLQKIPRISVAETSSQGSLEKNTFVPLSSDIDIVVKVNGFAGDEELQAELLKVWLTKKRGARLEDSGNHIVNCTFEGVAFDLVLVDNDQADERSKKITAHESRLDGVRLASEESRLKMQSFIRAVKYWAKRSGLTIKSCALEEAVVKIWADIKGHSQPFRAFLQQVGTALRASDNDVCSIEAFYELKEESIAAVIEKAKSALALLN